MNDRPTILLVEDDPDVAETVRSLLRAFGYDAEVAIDGNFGLRALRAGLRPALILLDLTMPNMDGHRFLELQREDAELSQIPTLVITAEPQMTAERLGVAGCLRKPFDPEVLLATIKQYC